MIRPDLRLTLAVLGVAAAAMTTLGVAHRAGWSLHGTPPDSPQPPHWAALFIAGWVLMTSAMMLPSSIPFLRAVQRVGGTRAGSIAGIAYIGVWTMLGAGMWAVLWASGAWLAGLGPGAAEALAATSLLIVAINQVSPLARACQRVCSRPFSVLARCWRSTATPAHNAWQAGVRYGLSCIGCCVYMVVLMLVVGASDVAWMFALGLVMAAQKRLRISARVTAAASALLAAAGLSIVMGWWVVPLRSLRALCGA